MICNSYGRFRGGNRPGHDDLRSLNRCVSQIVVDHWERWKLRNQLKHSYQSKMISTRAFKLYLSGKLFEKFHDTESIF